MLKRSFLVLTGIVVFSIALLGATIRPLSAAPLAQATSTPAATETAGTDETATTTGTAGTAGTAVSGTATTAGTEVSGTATTAGTATTTGGTGTTGTATTTGGTGTTSPGQLPNTGGESDGAMALIGLVVLLFLGGFTALSLARRNGAGR